MTNYSWQFFRYSSFCLKEKRWTQWLLKVPSRVIWYDLMISQLQISRVSFKFRKYLYSHQKRDQYVRFWGERLYQLYTATRTRKFLQKFHFCCIESINNYVKYEERNRENSITYIPFHYKAHMILDRVANALKIVRSWRNIWNETKIFDNETFLQISD